ncbi:MAG: hypothetical protein DBY04_04925 [Clostridiales bacterium]|nr:MAG: hypothetical protein DBY04_04925 [Clostridiales bacterium]
MLFSFSSDMIIIKDSIGGEAMEATETGSEIRERLGELARGKWKTAVRMVDTALICPNPFHAPEKVEESELRVLADVIRKNGMKNPLTIRAVGTAHHPMFQLIAGEKRLRACIYGEITPIPCVIIDANPDKLAQTGEIPLPRNYFEEAEIIYEILSQSGMSKELMAKRLGITEESLDHKLSLLNYDATERKIILKAQISAEAAYQLQKFAPEPKCELYRAIVSGVSGRTVEDLIAEMSADKRKTRIVIKDARLFYNTVDKAVAIMNKSGIPVKCEREERKTCTKLVITVPKSTGYTNVPRGTSFAGDTRRTFAGEQEASSGKPTMGS